MHENNTHESNADKLKVYWIALFLLMIMQSCNHTNRVEVFRLNPLIDSPYHFTINTIEKHSKRAQPMDQSSSFSLQFRTIKDSTYPFTFQFTLLDTALLRYFDKMDLQRNRIPDSAQVLLRKKYAQAFREAQNDTFFGQVKTNGELLFVKGFDQMRNRISKLLEIDRRDVYSMLHEQAGDQEIERLLHMVFMGVPGKAVKTGDTWVRNVMDNTRAPMKYSNLVTFSGRNADTVVLKVQIAISAKTGEEGSLYESGKGTGEMKVYALTGLPFEWSSQQQTEYRTPYDTITRTMIIKGSRIEMKN